MRRTVKIGQRCLRCEATCKMSLVSLGPLVRNLWFPVVQIPLPLFSMSKKVLNWKCWMTTKVGSMELHGIHWISLWPPFQAIGKVSYFLVKVNNKSLNSFRTLRIYNTKNYKNKSKTHKAALPVEVENKVENPSSQTCIEERNVRLFHDDTFQSFYRRLDFSPDGELLVIPSGVLEIDGETSIKSCTYVFSRENFLKPVLYLPAKDISIAVRFSPIKYELRPIPRQGGIEEAVPGQPWTRYQTLFALPYRMIYAIGNVQL